MAGGAVAGGQWPGVTDPDAFRAQVADWLTQDANPGTRRSCPLALGLPLTWVATPHRPRGLVKRGLVRQRCLVIDTELAALPLGEFADRLALRPVAIAATEAGLLRRSLFFTRRPD